MKTYSDLFYLFIAVTFLSTLIDCEDPTKEYSSYRRNPLCSPSHYIRYPKTEQDVVKIVAEAIKTGVKVKAFGERHSQTDIICTEGIPVDNRGLQYFKMNADGTATFGAGVNLRACTEFLRKNQRGLKTTPAFGNITLGGAIGTGAHGSTIWYNASISSQVVGVRLVDGMGKIREISNSEDLNALRIHLGLLGIVLKVTLATVPLYKTRAQNRIVSDKILTNGVAINWAKNTDQIAFYWFPAFEEVVVANWTIVDVNTPGDAWTNDHVPSTYDNFALIAAVAKEAAFSLTTSTCALANSLGYTILHIIEYYLQLGLLMDIPDWVPIYTEDGVHVKNPAVARQKFIAAMNKFDPNEVFINNFGRRLKKTGTKVDVDPLVSRCAILDNCFCSKDSDCGATQTCTTISGYNYRVCKTKNEVPSLFNKGLLPPPLGILNFLINNVPTLASALLGNCSLGALMSTLRGTASNILQTILYGINGVIGGIFG